MPIGPTSGFLDFTNATPRADVIVALSNIGIGTDAPLHALDLRGTANVANIIINNDLTLTGGLITNTLTINNVSMSTTTNFQQVTNGTGNVTTNTIEFNNPTTGLVVASNAEVGGELSVSGNVGVGTSEPTESLDIVGNLNLQKVSNTASIKLNSNVVTEYTRSKKLIKYPRVALTSAASNAYENGYKITYSHEYSTYQAWEAFNNDPSDIVGWYSGVASGTIYNGTDGAYGGTTQLASETELGEWIGLEVPSPIKLYDIRMVAQSYSSSSNTIDDFVIYAKKQSGDTWTNLGKFTGLAARQGTAAGVTVNVKSSDYYKFFALVATKRQAYTADQGVSIRVLDFFGIPEYDPEAHGTDVIARSVPNVPNTDWLQVYWDGQDYTSMPATVTDKSGNGATGTPNGGVGFDTEYKAFTFDGTDDYISGTLNNPAGAWVHSVSCWWKTSVDPGTSYDTIFSLGDYTATEFTTFYIKSNEILVSIYSSGARFPFSVELNRWYHATVVMRGTTSSINDIDFYLDGVKLNSSGQFGTATTRALPANASLRLGREVGGGASYLNGSIANFRLFNRALTTDEVWQLYAYQKEYFDVSPDVVTFKGGRLGIGTSEPRAPLDVMGIPYGPGATPRFYIRSTSTVTTTAAGTVQFNYALIDSHNGFNPSTYTYVVQVAGVYRLHGDVLLRQTQGTTATAGSRIEIRINGARKFASYGAGEYNTEVTVPVQGIYYCNVGDTINMYHTAINNGDVYISATYQGFSGFLLC